SAADKRAAFDVSKSTDISPPGIAAGGATRLITAPLLITQTAMVATANCIVEPGWHTHLAREFTGETPVSLKSAAGELELVRSPNEESARKHPRPETEPTTADSETLPAPDQPRPGGHPGIGQATE